VQLPGVAHVDDQRVGSRPVIKRPSATGPREIRADVQQAGDFARRHRHVVRRTVHENRGIPRADRRGQRAEGRHRQRPGRVEQHDRHGLARAFAGHLGAGRTAEHEPKIARFLADETGEERGVEDVSQMSRRRQRRRRTIMTGDERVPPRRDLIGEVTGKRVRHPPLR
jgi:hypothetical protein